VARSASTLAAGVAAYPVTRFRWFTVAGVMLWATWASLLRYLSGALFRNDPVHGLILGYAASAAW
jgi:membrane-associated protein